MTTTARPPEAAVGPSPPAVPPEAGQLVQLRNRLFLVQDAVPHEDTGRQDHHPPGAGVPGRRPPGPVPPRPLGTRDQPPGPRRRHLPDPLRQMGPPQSLRRLPDRHPLVLGLGADRLRASSPPSAARSTSRPTSSSPPPRAVLHAPGEPPDRRRRRPRARPSRPAWSCRNSPPAPASAPASSSARPRSSGSGRTRWGRSSPWSFT